MARHNTPNDAVAETISSERTERTHDWTARARGTAVDAQRYTRFVAIMKRVLLLAAIALIVAVAAYSLQPRDTNHFAMTFEKVGDVANDLAMVKPRLNGTDSEGNPFVVTADSAVQQGKNSRTAMLNNVQADITLKKGGWLNASAQHGLLDATAKTVQLSGDIAVFSDTGYELHTSSAHVDLNKGTVVGKQEVHGQGPFGTMRADGFALDRQTHQVHLLGNVRMTFYIHKSKKS